MLINQFNGGLNTRQAPQMLQLNQAVVYENIDNSLGTLTPVKKPLVRPDLVLNQNPFWFEAAQRWINGDGRYIPRVELNNRVYEAELSAFRVYTVDSPTYDFAGVFKPTSAPTVSPQPSPIPVVSVKLTPQSSASPTALPQGTYSYLFLNKNATGYGAGLSIQVDASGQSVLRNNDYFWRRDQTITIQQYEIATGADVGTKQTITIGPTEAVIDPAYGVDVYRLYNGKHRKVTTLTSYTSTFVDNVHDISANDELEVEEFSPLKGTYQYVVTHVNSRGIESQPSDVSAEVELPAGGQVTLGLPQYFAAGGKLRIYRVGGNLTKFSLVAELPGTTITYIDTLSDTEIDGRVLTSQNYGIALGGMQTLVTAYGMLFGSYENKLLYTNPGEPEYWPASYFIQFPTDITGLAAVANGILVMTKTATYLVIGTGPLVLQVQLLRSDQGCIDRRSVQTFQGNALWVSRDGICLSSGSNVEVISKQQLGKLSLTNVTSSVLYNEVYYAVYDTNKVLAADFSFGGLVFKNFQFSVATGNAILSFFKDSSKLYLTNVSNRYEAFAGTDYEVFKYKSPRFIEGRATENKTYKKIYIYAENAVLLKVYINDELVASKQMAAGTKDSITLQVPQEKQRGFFIQFEVEGDGQVFELEYEASGRQDG